MEKYEVNAKVIVDSTQLDETLGKIKELKEALWVVNGLLDELNGTKEVDVMIETNYITN